MRGRRGPVEVMVQVVVLVEPLGPSGRRTVALLFEQASLEAVLIERAFAFTLGDGGAVGALLTLAGEALGVPASTTAVETGGGGAKIVVSSHANGISHAIR